MVRAHSHTGNVCHFPELLRRMKIKLSLSPFAALACAAVLSTETRASDFDFSYILTTGDVLSGCIAGTIGPDGNTVTVSSVTMAMLNGVLGPDLTSVESFQEFISGSAADPTVSFDGTVMDIIAASLSFEGFLIDGTALVFGSPFFISSSFYGNTAEPFDSANWSLTQRTSVPDGGWTLGMLGLGAGILLGFGCTARRN